MRKHAGRMRFGWFLLGLFDLVMLLLATGISNGHVNASMIFLLLSIFMALHAYPVYLVAATFKVCLKLEQTVRRRYRPEGDRRGSGQDVIKGPVGLDQIMAGDEPGVVYFLTGQVRSRLHNYRRLEINRQTNQKNMKPNNRNEQKT